ncbi:MAG: hypothetical protein MI810_01120 [Flavobacteriales bacterium]|nr:hypothetical protein [Flavobacteriales bacterium]
MKILVILAWFVALGHNYGFAQEQKVENDAILILADSCFLEKDYKGAFEYYSTLYLRDSSDYSFSRLEDISTIFDEKWELMRENLHGRFKTLGDSCFSRKNYFDAKFLFSIALKTSKKGKRRLKKKLEKTELLDKNERKKLTPANFEIKTEFENVILKANKLFEEGKYLKAQSYFLRAVTIGDNETYPKLMVEIIDEIIRG